MRAENKGVLFAYSVEVDESKATQQRTNTPTPYSESSENKQLPAHKRIVDEMIRSIDVAADFEDRYAHTHTHRTASDRKTWVAIKLVS